MELHDRDIREPLFEYLEETHGRMRILEEKEMGESRADVVMVTEDSCTGIEIKSDADSYARLKSQVADYDRYFDYNMIVVGSTHAMHAAEHVPDWWGILSVERKPDGELDFYRIRPCRRNGNPDVLRGKLSLLWKDELFRIQQAFDMPKYAQKSRAFIAAKIAEMAKQSPETPELLSRMISEALLERDYTLRPRGREPSGRSGNASARKSGKASVRKPGTACAGKSGKPSTGRSGKASAGRSGTASAERKPKAESGLSALRRRGSPVRRARRSVR